MDIIMDMNEIPIDIKLKAFYSGICKALDFIEEIMIPQLDTLVKLSKASSKPLLKKDEYIIQLYRRIHLWMITLKALNDPIHFQAVASAARSIVELLVDIKLIINGKPANPSEKIEAFIQIEKFRHAKEYSDFKKKNPTLKYIKGLKREDLANKFGEDKRMDDLQKINWSNKKGIIPHWSGWGTKKRFEEAGKEFELLYYEYFGLWSWYVHSAGLTGIKGVTPEGFKAIFALAHSRILDVFCNTTELIANNFYLKSAMPRFDEWMESIRNVAGEVIVEYARKKGQ